MHLNVSIRILSEKNEKIWYNLLLKLFFKVSIGIRKGFTQSLYYRGLRCQMTRIVARVSLLFSFHFCQEEVYSVENILLKEK